MLNIVLVAICLGLIGTLAYALRLLKQHGLISARNPEPALVVTNLVSQTKILTRKINAENLLAALSSRPLGWGALESTNYTIYMENLQSFGCPEETIHDIILTDLGRHYGRRRAQLLAGVPFQFWKANAAAGGEEKADPTVREQLAALDQERDDLAVQLLGVDFRTEMLKYWGQDAGRTERLLTFLPEEKRTSVQALRRKFEQLEDALYAQSQGVLLGDDLEQLRKIRSQEKQELGELLSGEELEEYELRFSPTAEAMRSRLAGFEPTEEEFRRIFKLQQVFDENFDHAFAANDPEALAVKEQAEEEAKAALDQEIKNALGPQRYVAYTRSQDADYQQLRQVTDRFGLSEKLAARVYDMRNEAQRQKERLEANPNLSATQRQNALAAIAQETERSVKNVLGDQTFRAYKSGGVAWIDDLRNTAVIPEPEPVPSPEPEPLPPGVPPPQVLVPLPLPPPMP